MFGSNVGVIVAFAIKNLLLTQTCFFQVLVGLHFNYIAYLGAFSGIGFQYNTAVHPFTRQAIGEREIRVFDHI